jgi:hypothetical protein
MVRAHSGKDWRCFSAESNEVSSVVTLKMRQIAPVKCHNLLSLEAVLDK